MAQFRGTTQGTSGEASRLGTKNSGLVSEAAGWGGKIVSQVFHRDGLDYFKVSIEPHQNSGGKSTVIAEGLLSAKDPRIVYPEVEINCGACTVAIGAHTYREGCELAE